MGMMKEFRDFAMRGSVVDLAVAVVIGGAFGKIVGSFVSNVVMPPIQLLTARAGINFSTWAIKINTEGPKLKPDGSMEMGADGTPVMALQDYPILNIGPFIQTVVDFLLVAMAIFIAIKIMNTVKARFEEEKEAAVTAPSEEILLLRDIRDSLGKR